MKNKHDLSYRIAAVDGASPIGLLLAMYDTLAGDLLRAAEALRAGNIELRCSQLNHAYTVLAHLESWLDSGRPGKLDESLIVFYGYLRARMLEASIRQSAPMLDELIELVLQVRATWQQRQSLTGLDNAPLAERAALSHSA